MPTATIQRGMPVGADGAPNPRGIGATPHRQGTPAIRSDLDTIRRCITGTVRSKDGRGVYQNELACYTALHPNTTPTIAYLTAQAARIVGQAIKKVVLHA